MKRAIPCGQRTLALGTRTFFRAFIRSSSRCSTTKNDGTNSTARQVEAIMPLNTDSPSDTRAAAPAPVAVSA